jgi:hypothetical protein
LPYPAALFPAEIRVPFSRYGQDPRFPLPDPYFLAKRTAQIGVLPSGSVFFSAGYGSYNSFMKKIRISREKVPLENHFLLFQRCLIEKSTDTSAIPRGITVSVR